MQHELTNEEIAEIKAQMHKEIDCLGNHLFEKYHHYKMYDMVELINAAQKLTSDYYTPKLIETVNGAITERTILNTEKGREEEFISTNVYISDSIYYLTGISSFIAKAIAHT